MVAQKLKSSHGGIGGDLLAKIPQAQAPRATPLAETILGKESSEFYFIYIFLYLQGSSFYNLRLFYIEKWKIIFKDIFHNESSILSDI